MHQQSQESHSEVVQDGSDMTHATHSKVACQDGHCQEVVIVDSQTMPTRLHAMLGAMMASMQGYQEQQADIFMVPETDQHPEPPPMYHRPCAHSHRLPPSLRGILERINSRVQPQQQEIIIDLGREPQAEIIVERPPQTVYAAQKHEAQQQHDLSHWQKWSRFISNEAAFFAFFAVVTTFLGFLAVLKCYRAHASAREAVGERPLQALAEPLVSCPGGQVITPLKAQEAKPSAVPMYLSRLYERANVKSEAKIAKRLKAQAKERIGKAILAVGLPAIATIVLRRLARGRRAGFEAAIQSLLTYVAANVVVDTFHYWEDESLEVRTLKDKQSTMYSIAFANELHHFCPKALTLRPSYANVSDLVEQILPVIVAGACVFRAAGWSFVRPLELWAYGVFIVYNHAQCHKHRSLKNPIMRILHDYCGFLLKNSEQHAKHHELGAAGWSIATVNFTDLILDNIVPKLFPNSAGGKKHIKEYQQYWTSKMNEIHALQKKGHAFTAAEQEEHLEYIEDQCKQFVEATPGWHDRSEEAAADVAHRRHGTPPTRKKLLQKKYHSVLVASDTPRRPIQSSPRDAQVGLDGWLADLEEALRRSRLEVPENYEADDWHCSEEEATTSLRLSEQHRSIA